MKSLVAFVCGAILAGSIVYFMVRPKPVANTVVQPTPADDQQVATVEKVPMAEQPVERPTVRPRPTALPHPAASKPVAHVEQAAKTTTPPPAPELRAQGAPPPQASVPAAAPMRQAEAAPAPQAPTPPVRQPATVTIPAGTILVVRIDDSLSTEKNAAGDTFRATLDAPLIVDGMAIAERGARAQGRIVDCDKGGKVKGLARMTLSLVLLNTSDGQKVRLETDTYAHEAKPSTTKDAVKVGAGSGIGAAIGAAAGGGKGAAIGAGAGAAAGTADVLLTRGKAAEVPAETRVSFRLEQPITLTERL